MNGPMAEVVDEDCASVFQIGETEGVTVSDAKIVWMEQTRFLYNRLSSHFVNGWWLPIQADQWDGTNHGSMIH